MPGRAEHSWLLLVVTLVLLLGGAVGAALGDQRLGSARVETAIDAGTQLPAGLRRAIDEAVEESLREQRGVGAAIGVIRDGRVVMTSGDGFADRERRSPVTRETLFRWASISKPLTAVVSAQLAREGELDLDADVRELVPEFPDKGAAITQKQLLAHLGGIVHYSNGVVVRTPIPDPSAERRDVIAALSRFKASELVAVPGEEFAYTTHGYILASAVAERAGGMSYERLVSARIAAPLGMDSLRPDRGDGPGLRRATGYRVSPLGMVVESPDTDVSWKLGGGGWMSNIDDLAAFAAGLLGDELIDADTKRLLWTEQETAAGEGTSYGLGFHVSRPRGRLRVAHNGSQEGARCRLVLYPEDNHGVVVMSNSEHVNPGRITTAVYRAIAAWEREEAANR